MTQTQLSQASGFSTGYISDLLHGRRHPNGRVIARFAEVLKVPKSMLIPHQEKEEAA